VAAQAVFAAAIRERDTDPAGFVHLVHVDEPLETGRACGSGSKNCFSVSSDFSHE
jgi:hypothetical protein